MRKQTLTESTLEEKPTDEIKKVKQQRLLLQLLQNDVKDLLLVQIIKETIQWKTTK